MVAVGRDSGTQVDHVDDNRVVFAPSLTSAITTPAATLADAMVAYDAGDWRVAFNVVNLTDKVHITQCLARGDCFYGQARTYTLTSTYRF